MESVWADSLAGTVGTLEGSHPEPEGMNENSLIRFRSILEEENGLLTEVLCVQRDCCSNGL